VEVTASVLFTTGVEEAVLSIIEGVVVDLVSIEKCQVLCLNTMIMGAVRIVHSTGVIWEVVIPLGVGEVMITEGGGVVVGTAGAAAVVVIHLTTTTTTLPASHQKVQTFGTTTPTNYQPSGKNRRTTTSNGKQDEVNRVQIRVVLCTLLFFFS